MSACFIRAIIIIIRLFTADVFQIIYTTTYCICKFLVILFSWIVFLETVLWLNLCINVRLEFWTQPNVMTQHQMSEYLENCSWHVSLPRAYISVFKMLKSENIAELCHHNRSVWICYINLMPKSIIKFSHMNV